MIVGICLLILTMLGVFNIILGGTFMGSITETFIDNTAIVNGTSSSFVIEGQDWIFNLDPITGAIAWFTIIAGISAGVGVKILASGLSDESIKVIIKVIIYSTLWGLLSTGAWGLIWSIEVFGGLIYLSLTLVYAIGVIQGITGDNNNG